MGRRRLFYRDIYRTGQQVGFWTILLVMEGYPTKIRCQCKCGKISDVFAGNKGNSRGCLKCCHTSTAKDLSGKIFGKITAISPTNKRKRNCVIWNCKCGHCGNSCEIRSNDLIRGAVKSCGCLHYARGPLSQNYRGGRHISHGYVKLSGHQGHPNASSGGQIAEHILVMSNYLQRPIKTRKLGGHETVHHKNTIRTDNRIENLELRVGNHGPGGNLIDVIDYWTQFIKDHAHEYEILKAAVSNFSETAVA